MRKRKSFIAGLKGLKVSKVKKVIEALIDEEQKHIDSYESQVNELENALGRYKELGMTERHYLKAYRNRMIDSGIKKINQYGELLLDYELIADIDYLIATNNLNDELHVWSIIECCIELKEFEKSRIDIKRYDELEERLKKNAEELERYSDDLINIFLPNKPEDSLNSLMSQLEATGLAEDVVEYIIKVISNRQRLPKGQKERKEFDAVLRKSKKDFRKIFDVEQLGNGQIKLSKK